MELTRKLQYTSLALVLFIMSYMISGLILVAYVWLITGFILWLNGGSRYNVLKISLFWLIALWIDPVSKWMLDTDIE